MRFTRALLVLVLAFAATSVLAADLTVSIAPAVEQSVLSPAEGAMLRFAITNTTDGELAFVRYNTPLGGFENDLFTVYRDGNQLPYIGKMALRLGPTTEDWVVLEAGETVESIINLAEAYDMRAGGNYVIRFNFPINSRIPDEREGAIGERRGEPIQEIESNEVDIQVDGPLTVPELAKPEIRELAYSGCTSSQQTSISTARSNGSSLAAKAYNQMAAAGSTNTLYKTWFGAYTSTRYSTVRGKYNKIYTAFQRTWNYTCTTCQSGVIAYVYPSNPYNVWICAYFHQFSAKQKGSFLLHEASHWTVVAATQDYGYGESFCKNLAKTNPTNAIKNADSYRYFSLYVP
jgi:peptidyl-Lys metalloendopeptidase